MFSHATSHANRSKKNSLGRRSISIDGNVIPHKSEIVGRDKNGNYPTNLINKQPVFAQRRMNRSNSNDNYTQDHVNTVKYLSSTWQSVRKELDKKSLNSNPEFGPQYYCEKEANPQLKNFKQFDLEKWMDERLYRQISKYTDTSS